MSLTVALTANRNGGNLISEGPEGVAGAPSGEYPD